MNPGALLAFAAYASFSVGDSAIKALGNTNLTTFEITFFSALFTALAMLFLRPRGEPLRDIFRVRHPVLLFLRSLCSLGAGLLGVIALITIPFAETYALIFTAPFLVILLSIVILRERITWVGALAMIIGFTGVLIVVRPGLRTLEAGHLAAAFAAFFVALATVLIRRIAPTENRSSLLIVPQLVTAIGSGAVLTTHYTAPTMMELVLLLVSGGFIGLAQLFMILAARRVPAGTIGQAQFSQLIWAILLGALLFREIPDVWSLVGVAVIAAGGLLTLSDRRVTATPVPLDPSRG